MTGKLTTLLVEDTPGDASIIEFYLAEQFGEFYHFFHVDNFRDCLQELKMKKYDVVLLDLDLPDSQGINTLKTLMSNFPEQLVIVLTGLNDEKTGLETVQKGANDYMVKGKFDAEILNSKIKFAYERYLTKVKNNQNHFDNHTINNILTILNAGYLEIEKEHLVITKIQLDNLAHIFELPARSLSHLCSSIENCEELKSKLNELCTHDTRLEFVGLTTSGLQIKIEGKYSQTTDLISVLIWEKQEQSANS